MSSLNINGGAECDNLEESKSEIVSFYNTLYAKEEMRTMFDGWLGKSLPEGKSLLEGKAIFLQR